MKQETKLGELERLLSINFASAGTTFECQYLAGKTLLEESALTDYRSFVYRLWYPGPDP